MAVERLTEHDLIAYRQAMIAAGKRPTTVNRRLDALRRLCRWAQGAGTLTIDITCDLRRVRLPRNRQRYRQLDGRRSRRMKCCLPYAAAATPLTSAHSAKALVRAARYSVAETCSRQRGKRLLI